MMASFSFLKYSIFFFIVLILLLNIGVDVTLEPDAEEVASFFAALIETDYAKNPTFVANFFKDFLSVLSKQNQVLYISFLFIIF